MKHLDTSDTNDANNHTSDTHTHTRTHTKSRVINYAFACTLLLFLALILIAAIRHQKYRNYLQTLNSHSTATSLHPQILAKSKLIMEAFAKEDFDTLQVLVDAAKDDDKERSLLRRALYDYSLTARPHLTDHILSRPCTRSLQILLESHAIDPNHLHLLHTVISDMKGHAKHREFMEMLLDHGADPDLPNRKGIPPIAHAITHTNLEALEILLSHRAQINVRLNSHDSFLHFAVLSFLDPPLEIIAFLLSNGANPFHRGSDGLTPFHHAIRKHPGNLSLIRVFLNTTPPQNVNAESYRQALLHYPSASRDVIHPTEYTRYGYSPLHWAVASCKPALVRLLLNHGANPAQPDSDNISPRQLAISLKNRQIIAMFR